jgi:hypothetical protein
MPAHDSLIFEAIFLLFYYSIGSTVQSHMGTASLRFTICWAL